MIEVRQARPGDGVTLHTMVRELAVHHGEESNFRSVAGGFRGRAVSPAEFYRGIGRHR